MPGLNGIDVLKQVISSLPDLRVILCSVESDPEFAEAALQAGALAYVVKLRIQKDLLQAAKSALQGKQFTSPA